MTRCKFKQGKFNCGSYAFNLYKDDIDQGDLCDVHYWQEKAQKSRVDEREALERIDWTALMRQGGLVTWGDAQELGDRVIATIRARSGEQK
jgi:hypothetical protein